jgi:predicted dehydrogenase
MAGRSLAQPLQHTKLDPSGPNAYVNQLRHFVEIMRGTARPIVGIDEALATQAGLEAVFISAQEGRRVSTKDLIDRARSRAIGKR